MKSDPQKRLWEKLSLNFVKGSDREQQTSLTVNYSDQSRRSQYYHDSEEEDSFQKSKIGHSSNKKADDRFERNARVKNTSQPTTPKLSPKRLVRKLLPKQKIETDDATLNSQGTLINLMESTDELNSTSSLRGRPLPHQDVSVNIENPVISEYENKRRSRQLFQSLRNESHYESHDSEDNPFSDQHQLSEKEKLLLEFGPRQHYRSNRIERDRMIPPNLTKYQNNKKNMNYHSDGKESIDDYPRKRSESNPIVRKSGLQKQARPISNHHDYNRHGEYSVDVAETSDQEEEGEEDDYDENTPLVGCSSSSRPGQSSRSIHYQSTPTSPIHKRIHHISGDPRLADIENDVNEATVLTQTLIERMINRKDQLKTMKKQADNLKSVGVLFKRNARRAQYESWLEKNRNALRYAAIISITITIVILTFIILAKLLRTGKL